MKSRSEVETRNEFVGKNPKKSTGFVHDFYQRPTSPTAEKIYQEYGANYQGNVAGLLGKLGITPASKTPGGAPATPVQSAMDVIAALNPFGKKP